MTNLDRLIERLKQDPREAELAEKFLDGLQVAKTGGHFIVLPPYEGAPTVVVSYSKGLRQQLQPVVDQVVKKGKRIDG